MVNISVSNGILHLDLVGWSKWLALANGLDIPLRCISRATAGEPGLPRFRWTDLRVGGTSVPGLLAMGRFEMGDPRRRTFLVLRRSSKDVLILELTDYPYEVVMVEVDNVVRVLGMIHNAGG